LHEKHPLNSHPDSSVIFTVIENFHPWPLFVITVYKGDFLPFKDGFLPFNGTSRIGGRRWAGGDVFGRLLYVRLKGIFYVVGRLLLFITEIVWVPGSFQHKAPISTERSAALLL
jgi:hypothetical protein